MKLHADYTIRNAYRQALFGLSKAGKTGSPVSSELKTRIEFLERIFDL